MKLILRATPEEQVNLTLLIDLCEALKPYLEADYPSFSIEQEVL